MPGPTVWELVQLLQKWQLATQLEMLHWSKFFCSKKTGIFLPVLYTSLQEFYHLRTNLQKSCSLWAKQQERPWIEGSGSGMYSCTQRPDSNTQAQVLPSSFRGFEERKKKQNTLYKAVDSGWSWKIKVVKQVPWTTRYLLGFIAGACATLPFTTSALQCAGTGWNWLRCCLCAPRQVLLCRIWQSMIEWVHRDFPLEISSRV